MSVTVNLPPETAKRLEEKATSQGVSVESYLVELVRRDVEVNGSSHSLPGSRDNLSAEQWIQEFRAWAASHDSLPQEADDSRESIYAGRGE